jgi:hypothetical protein
MSDIPKTFVEVSVFLKDRFVDEDKIKELFRTCLDFKDLKDMSKEDLKVMCGMPGAVLHTRLHGAPSQSGPVVAASSAVPQAARLQANILLPTWDGSAESVEIHIQTLREVLDACCIVDEKSKIIHFKSSLPAEERDRIVKTYLPTELSSFDKLVARFATDRGLSPEMALEHALAIATNHTHYAQAEGEPLSEYLLRVQKAMRRLSVVSNGQLDLTTVLNGAPASYYLRQGLRNDFYRTVATSRGIKWASVLEALQEIAADETSRASREKGDSALFTGQRKTVTVTDTATKTVGDRSKTPNATGFQGECFGCHKIGHKKQFCPELRRGNRSGQGDNRASSPRSGGGDRRYQTPRRNERHPRAFCVEGSEVSDSPSNIPEGRALMGAAITNPAGFGGGVGASSQVRGEPQTHLKPKGTAVLCSVQSTPVLLSVANRKQPVMVLDSGATIPIVSRGYVRKFGLMSSVYHSAKQVLQTAGEGPTESTERILVDVTLPSLPKPYSFQSEFVVLPTESLIPWLMSSNVARNELALTMEFGTGKSEFTPQSVRSNGSHSKFSLKWDYSDGLVVTEVVVVAPHKGRPEVNVGQSGSNRSWSDVVRGGKSAFPASVASSENGQSLGWTRGTSPK